MNICCTSFRPNSRLIPIALTMISLGCASLGEQPGDAEPLTISETSATDFKPVPFDQVAGLADYQWQEAAQKVEWIDCKAKTPQETRGTILAMHSDRAGFEDKRFCEGWIAQAFLSQGYDVVTVNRPGYGDSTGVVDFSGEQSMAALEVGVKAAMAQGQNAKSIEGVWGYSTGATAAALYAKRFPAGIKYLLLGGGIYDYEITLKETTDDYLKTDIQQILKTGGNTAMEERSIAYDVSGLPAVMALYHGKSDTTAPLHQAKAFADSLEGSGNYKVVWQVVEGVAHQIPWVHHRKILEVIVHSLPTAPTTAKP